MCLSSLFKELWPFENCKMYMNVLKIHFLNGQNSLENASKSLRFSWQMLLWILWNGRKIDSKLQTPPSTQTQEFFLPFFFLMPSPNLKEFFHFRPCVLSSLFKELWPFENCKMYMNVLKIHFLNGQNSLENASMSLRFSWQMLMWILWNGQKLDSKH